MIKRKSIFHWYFNSKVSFIEKKNMDILQPAIENQLRQTGIMKGGGFSVVSLVNQFYLSDSQGQ